MPDPALASHRHRRIVVIYMNWLEIQLMPQSQLTANGAKQAGEKGTDTTPQRAGPRSGSA